MVFFLFFCCAKILIKIHLFIFAFVSFDLGDIQKILLQFMSESVPPKFSSRTFMVSGVILRFLIHFELDLYMELENVVILLF